MAKSTYISTHLTEAQLNFLTRLDEHEILYFSLEDIESRLNAQFPKLNEIVENLCDKKLLDRIERGKYTRPQFKDPFVLGTYISRDGVVAYWSALHRHGLTPRFPNKTFIKTTTRKRNVLLFGTLVQYITVQPHKLIGTIQQGYGDKSYRLSDIACTLLDCFDQPQYAGDWADLLRAFYLAKPESQTLIQYASVYNRLAMIKRMGYLAELFEKKELNLFIDFAKRIPTARYSLFEAGGADEGSFNKNWKLRMNINEEDILDIIHSPY